MACAMKYRDGSILHMSSVLSYGYKHTDKLALGMFIDTCKHPHQEHTHSKPDVA